MQNEWNKYIRNCNSAMSLPSNGVDRGVFVRETLRLLAVEFAAETELAEGELDVASRRRLERLGLCVAGLRLESWRSGLYGRTILGFVSVKGVLSSNGFGVGDVVRVVPNEGPKKRDNESGSWKPASGIVSKVSEEMIEVAFSENTDDGELRELEEMVPLRLDKLPNSATNEKLLQAMKEIETLSPSHPSFHLAEVLFGEKQPLQNMMLQDGSSGQEMIPFNDRLNGPQLDAIKFALRSRDVALIHGPPGTGKTTAVTELILQAAQVHDFRVLVCSPSNVAVDNLVLRLDEMSSSMSRKDISKRKLRPLSMIRVGHPARFLPGVLRHSMDAVIGRSEAKEIVNDVRKELQDIIMQMISRRSSKKKKTERRRPFKELKLEAKELRKELRSRERAVVDSTIKQANVVLATNVGAASLLKKMSTESRDSDKVFDLVVIDEAAQAIEASCWIPILQGRRLVLAGDHKQLPPTIKSIEAEKGLLGTTLFDRVVQLYGDRVVKLLSIQYRMHQVINDWASKEMYEGRLVADSSVAFRKLTELDYFKSAQGHDDDEEGSPFESTLVFIDTAFCDLEESVEDEDELGQSPGSRFNRGEAIIVAKYVTKLLDAGMPESELAVITPYNAQVHLIRSMLLEKYPALEVRSVDGFQGREKEVVVLSLVRSNKKGMIGFLADDRRLNVAVTRAKRQVCLIADSETIGNEEGSFLARMISYFHDHAFLQSAEDFLGVAHKVQKVYGSASVAKQKSKKSEKSEQMKKNQKRPSQVTPERREELQGILRGFVDSRDTSLSCPPGMSGAERAVLHELAEALDLVHESFGENETRFLRVQKKSSIPRSDPSRFESQSKQQGKQVQLDVAEEEDDDDDDQQMEEQDTSQDAISTNFKALDESDGSEKDEKNEVMVEPLEKEQNSSVEKEDSVLESEESRPMTELQKIRLEQAERYKKKKEEEKVKQQQQSSSSSRNKKKSKKTKGKKKKKNTFEKSLDDVFTSVASAKAAEVNNNSKGGEDLSDEYEEVDPEMEFLDQVLRASKLCAVKACKRKVHTQFSTCKHCKLRFCHTHGLPEVHGCANVARTEARKNAISGSKHSTKLGATQRQALQKTLSEKISEASDARKAKPKKKNNKT